MDIRPNTATLGRKKGAQQFIALHHRALMQAGQGNRHWNTPVERRQQGGIRVFSRCGQQEKRGLPLLDIAQTPEMLAVHQVKQHLLAFGWQAKYFIEKKDTAMGLLYQTFTVTICPCISTSHNTKELGHQQLWVPCIIGAVEADEGRISRQCVKF